MGFYSRHVVLLFMALGLLPFVLTIKCWTCTSSTDPKCLDPFDNSTVPITNCNDAMCRKVRQKVNGEWHYIRDCVHLGEVGVQGDEKICVQRIGPNGISEECTCNSKDGCNSTSMINPIPLLLASLISICLIFKVV